MNSKSVLANISRWVARIGSIVVCIFGLFILIFIGGAAMYDTPIVAILCVYSLYFFGMLTGLAIAWKNESLGAAITMALSVLSFIVFFLANATGEASTATRVVLIFSISQLSIGLLFLISWLLRRKPPKMESQEGMSTGEERRKN